jgi:hypothetical protein
MTLRATIVYAGIIWCLLVAVLVTAANVHHERTQQRRRSRSVPTGDVVIAWLLIIVSYATGLLTLWALWQLAHGRWT